MRKRPTRRVQADAELSSEDRELFETLKEWRRKAARGKPAYTVANNRTLELIAAVRPTDLSALAEIHGIGPAFLKRHGEDVLELLRC